MKRLILPGDPLFDLTLSTPPPLLSGQTPVYVARSGSGILEPATPEQIEDYLYGGEYDQRQEEIGDVEPDWDYYD